MSARRITRVVVEYADGGSESWTGKGTVTVNRTPTAARGTPIPRDSDISYVEARIVFDREPVGEVAQ